MDELGYHELPNPYENANPFLNLMMCWILPFVRKGFKSTLVLKDIYSAPEEDKSKSISQKLERFPEQLKTPSKNGLHLTIFNRLWTSFGATFIVNVVCGCIGLILRMLFPTYLLGILLEYSAHTEQEFRVMRIYPSIGLVLVNFIGAVFVQKSMHVIDHVGIKCRVLCNIMIYSKCLRLNQMSMSKTSTGQIINCISADAAVFEAKIHRVVSATAVTISIPLYIVILWPNLNFTVFVGIAVYCLAIIPPICLTKWHVRTKAKISKATDERLRLTNDVLSGIKVIKMYAWEKPFLQLINKARRHEVNLISKLLAKSTFDVMIQFSGSKVAIFLTLLAKDGIFQKLTAQIIFVTVTAFSRLFLNSVANSAGDAASIFVAMTRIDNFLQIDTKCDSSRNLKQTTKKPTFELKSGAISIQNACASWDKTKNLKTLSDITLTLDPGKFIAIIGEVGSSKSSLLLAILGELILEKGRVDRNGTISYAPQEPWIFSGSVRQNILLGRQFDQDLYLEIIQRTQLAKDFDDFEHGDNTVLGDRGISVSGGQKARIGLARCLYQKSDIYLMDDPLSAVDSSVSQRIVTECFHEFLAKKTTVLVTHQIQVLKDTDQIVEFNQGKCSFVGTYDELIKWNVKYANAVEKEDIISEVDMIANTLTRNEKEFPQTTLIKYSNLNSKDLDNLRQRLAETQDTGTIKRKYYINYIKSGTIFYFSMFIVSLVVSQILSTCFDCWIGIWSKDTTLQKKMFSQAVTALRPITMPQGDGQDWHNIVVLAALLFGLLLFVCLRTAFFVLFCKTASLNLHTNMLTAILRSKMLFFDRNSSGRILNRFAKDLGTCDEQLPMQIQEALLRLLLSLCVIVPVTMSCYWMAPLSIVLIFVVSVITHVNLRSSTQLKRIDAVARGQTYQHTHATIQGLTTIRAFNFQEKFKEEFAMHLDIFTSVSFISTSLTRWLAMSLDLPGVAYIAVIILTMLIIDSDVSYLGLAISSAIQLGTTVELFVRNLAESVNLMTAVERVGEYTQLETEVELESLDSNELGKKHSDWPSLGKIEFRNVSAKYDFSQHFSLNKLSCIIQPKEKVGIVGRTGAGKSTFLNVLFRIIEPTGEIIIDGKDICKMGLHDLRQNISIIPQDPILFAGTLRMNVDPFGHYLDERILEALTDVQLRCLVDSSPDGLSAVVTAGGSNLSVGQRQLLCLARAILRDNKILVMDEATANVDHTTDGLIQKTIRQRFTNCTVFTIAHRIETIIDADKIMVLSDGELVEFDVPHVLLENKDGYFSKLVQQTGPEQAKLLNIAGTSYSNNKSL